MKLKLILLVAFLALGFAGIATSGSPDDTDDDLVPDVFDNCLETPNGPNERGLNQLDGDQDGYGNACDADYNNNGGVDGFDVIIFRSGLGTLDTAIDLNGDGVVDNMDFGRFIALFNTLPGPSGLACAGTIPCLP